MGTKSLGHMIRTPAPEEPIIRLLRRLHAEGDTAGSQAIHRLLLAARDEAEAEHRQAAQDAHKAEDRKRLTRQRMGEARKLADEADIIVGGTVECQVL